VIVAGAGIAGLTAALALARNGFRVIVLEQAERLEETGAGIQLSPNATRTLIDLGVGERLRPHAVAPEALRVLSAGSGREVVRMPLGAAAERRYGAPYWSIHRGDLQAALADAAFAHLDISVKLGMRMEDFAAHSQGVAVSVRGAAGIWHEHGLALIAADGLWSRARQCLGFREAPRFAGRTAWRALVPAKDVAPEFREPWIHLWLGRDAHLVHYPVKAGRVINIVAIVNDSWNGPGWSEPARRVDLLPGFPAKHWAPQARALLGQPEAWLKWALYDRRPLSNASHEAVALVGDAAHPMMPYLAQGAAMAIEDAAVAAQCLAQMPDDPAQAMNTYWAVRRARTRKVQRLAARNGERYHVFGLQGLLRNTAMRMLGGTRLLHHYDWLYDWRPPAALSIN
jgi:2-polyprenyl-6-methoxyphenol hydroxylase-like FAD-dependent oxidoreductase